LQTTISAVGLVAECLMFDAMIYAFFYGFGTGIVLSSMLGTVFFSLVQNSIDNGIKSNLYISFGVIFSDILLITLSHFNAQLIPKDGTAEMVVRLVGALFIIGLGLSNIYKKANVSYAHLEKRPAFLAVRGFTLNFFNPGNFFSWIAVSALLGNVLHFSMGGRIWFYIGALVAIFLMELLISYGAVALKRYINPKHLHDINVIMGFIFLAFGIVLLWPIIAKIF
jgi:L-lysine exporter family protein LysE/ArgO